MPHDQRTTDTSTQPPITRRSALQTGGIAALAAGLLGMAGTQTASAEPAPAPALSATISLSGPVTASDPTWLAEWREQHDEARAALDAAWAETERRLSGDGRRLMMSLESAWNRMETLEEAWLIEAMCAHLPGLAGALRLVYEHVAEGPREDELGCCKSL